MPIIEANTLQPEIVRPFVTTAYVLMNKLTTATVPVDEELWNSHSYFAGSPITKIYSHLDPEIAFNGEENASTKPFILGQYHNTAIDILKPITPAHDVLTDIITHVFNCVVSDRPEQAYVAMSAYNLLSRIASENQPAIGGSPEAIEVKPYVI